MIMVQWKSDIVRALVCTYHNTMICLSSHNIMTASYSVRAVGQYRAPIHFHLQHTQLVSYSLRQKPTSCWKHTVAHLSHVKSLTNSANQLWVRVWNNSGHSLNHISYTLSWAIPENPSCVTTNSLFSSTIMYRKCSFKLVSYLVSLGNIVKVGQ